MDSCVARQLSDAKINEKSKDPRFAQPAWAGKPLKCLSDAKPIDSTNSFGWLCRKTGVQEF
jgi:hypothetical protein